MIQLWLQLFSVQVNECWVVGLEGYNWYSLLLEITGINNILSSSLIFLKIASWLIHNSYDWLKIEIVIQIIPYEKGYSVFSDGLKRYRI